MNGPAGQGEGRCSGGDKHHSASGSVLWNEILVRRSFISTFSSGSSVDSRLRLTSSCVSPHQYARLDRLKQLVDDWRGKMKLSVGLCSQHNTSKREGTWWEGPGWDRGHDNPSGRSRHVGHLLPVLSVQTPAAGSVGKRCSGNTLTCQHTALHLMCRT